MKGIRLGLALGALAFSAWAADPQASRYYEDALIRYEKKDLDGAIIQLKNALQIDKSMLPVQMLLGRALLQNGEVAAAEVALLEALRLGVNRAEVVVLLGQAYLAQGKHRLLFEQHHFSLSDLPPAVRLQLLLLRATASADLGNPREALQAVNDARAIDAQAPETWLAEVPIRIRSHQFREAMAAADRALALAPQLAEAWYQKASVHHVAGDPDKALAAYGRVIERDATHVEALVARAGIFLDLGRHAEAVADIAALAKASPKEPRAAYLRALLAERDGKTDEARKALREVTSLIDPVPIDFIRYRPQLLMLNGLAHFGLNEHEKAKGYLESFQRVQGNTPAAKSLARIYMGEARNDRAVDVLETYLKAHPADGQAMVLLGTALQAKGQHARAVSLMKQALEARDAPEFRTVLGLSLIRSGQVGSAIPELEAALAQNPIQAQAATALVGLYLRTGQTDKAVKLAESMVKRRAASADFYNLLGVAERQAGDRTAARAAFVQAVKLDAKLVGAQLNLARLDIAEGAFDAAAARLNPLFKANEKNPEVLFELSVLAERRGQPADAQRWLEKTVDIGGPREIRWPLALANFHMRHGRAEPALEAAKIAISRAPEDLSAILTLARLSLANKDATAARVSLTTATRVAEFNAQAQVQIALLQIEAGNLDGAAYSLEKALSGQPSYLPAQALMAGVELQQGAKEKAEKRARAIVDKHPKLAIGHSLMGDIALARGETATALDAYRRAHQTEPSTDTLLRLFRNLSGKDDQAAVQLAEQWLQNHPKDQEVLRALADGQARIGNFLAARRSYESLVKLAPDNAPVLNNLANVLHRLKDPEALIFAERAVAKDPQNADAIDTLGWLLFEQGHTDRALQLLREARLRSPESAEIRYHLGVVLAKSGRNKEAVDELSSSLMIGSRFAEESEARKLLNTLR